LYVLKSRGMGHSNQIRELLITKEGLRLNDVYVGPGGVLTGTARVTQEAAETAEAMLRTKKIERLRRELERKENTMNLRIKEIINDFDVEKEEIEQAISEAKAKEKVFEKNRDKLAQMRGRD
jgi:circadian clock protein KaiC